MVEKKSCSGIFSLFAKREKKHFVKRKIKHLEMEKANIVGNFFSLEKIHQFFVI
jgi:hypothetical protein